MALALDLLAAGIALTAYVLGARICLGRRQRLAWPLIRPSLILSRPSNDNEACHVRAASGR